MRWGSRQRWRGYGAATLVVGVCTLLGGLSHWWALTEANIVMIFLAGVALTAAKFGHGPALAAMTLSVVSYDFFFVAPVFAFAMVEAQYVITLGVMVAIGLLISELTSRLRVELEASQAQERRTALLYRMTQELGHLSGTEGPTLAAGKLLSDTFDADVALYVLEGDGRLRLAFGAQHGLALDPASANVAQRVADQGSVATRAMAGGTGVATFVPMEGIRRMIGVVGVLPRDAERLADRDERRMLQTCANLIALTLERDQSAADAQRAQSQVETEKLRNTLLTSISHDLRTPLATIAVTSSELLDGLAGKSAAETREVLETVVDETRQLARQVDNLLDLGRVNSSDGRMNCEWQVLEELVGVALARLRRELAWHHVEIDIPGELPLVWAAGDLLGQVLVNLLENAARYTPAGSRIEISARARDAWVEMTIADDGPGLPAGCEAAVFEKFVRGPTKVADGRRGLGLGLAICRSIIEAHGGEIFGRNRAGGGAEFLVRLKGVARV